MCSWALQHHSGKDCFAWGVDVKTGKLGYPLAMQCSGCNDFLDGTFNYQSDFADGSCKNLQDNQTKKDITGCTGSAGATAGKLLADYYNGRKFGCGVREWMKEKGYYEDFESRLSDLDKTINN